MCSFDARRKGSLGHSLLKGIGNGKASLDDPSWIGNSANINVPPPTRYIHNQAAAARTDPLTYLLPLSMNSDLITEIKPSKSAPLFGFWYPACPSSELAPDSLKGTVLLGLPILVCKTSQGAVAAMRDICPHRGMPLSFGKMEGDCVKCAYHGWQFDQEGRCRGIPALVQGSPIQVDKIGITTYPAANGTALVWVFIPDPRTIEPDHSGRAAAAAPLVSLSDDSHLDAVGFAIDDGIVGLMDPAHGLFVHQSSWWRTQAKYPRKGQDLEPIPNGFRMVPHAPSKNSGPYRLPEPVLRRAADDDHRLCAAQPAIRIRPVRIALRV